MNTGPAMPPDTRTIVLHGDGWRQHPWDGDEYVLHRGGTASAAHRAVGLLIAMEDRPCASIYPGNLSEFLPAGVSPCDCAELGAFYDQPHFEILRDMVPESKGYRYIVDMAGLYVYRAEGRL